MPTELAWSYLHLPIFAAVAAGGAGLVVAIEETSGHAHLGWVAVGTAVGVPIIVYLLSLGALYVRVPRGPFHQLLLPVAVALIIGAIFTPAPVLALGLVLVGMVAVKVALHVRDAPRTEALASAVPSEVDGASPTPVHPRAHVPDTP